MNAYTIIFAIVSLIGIFGIYSAFSMDGGPDGLGGYLLWLFALTLTGAGIFSLIATLLLPDRYHIYLIVIPILAVGALIAWVAIQTASYRQEAEDLQNQWQEVVSIQTIESQELGIAFEYTDVSDSTMSQINAHGDKAYAPITVQISDTEVTLFEPTSGVAGRISLLDLNTTSSLKSDLEAQIAEYTQGSTVECTLERSRDMESIFQNLPESTKIYMLTASSTESDDWREEFEDARDCGERFMKNNPNVVTPAGVFEASKDKILFLLDEDLERSYLVTATGSAYATTELPKGGPGPGILNSHKNRWYTSIRYID